MILKKIVDFQMASLWDQWLQKTAMWSTSFQADFVCFAHELHGKLFLKIVADFLFLRGFEQHIAVM